MISREKAEIVARSFQRDAAYGYEAVQHNLRWMEEDPIVQGWNARLCAKLCQSQAAHHAKMARYYLHVAIYGFEPEGGYSNA